MLIFRPSVSDRTSASSASNSLLFLLSLFAKAKRIGRNCAGFPGPFSGMRSTAWIRDSTFTSEIDVTRFWLILETEFGTADRLGVPLLRLRTSVEELLRVWADTSTVSSRLAPFRSLISGTTVHPCTRAPDRNRFV